MARSRKTPTSPDKSSDPVTPEEGTVEDAEVVDEIPPDQDSGTEEALEPDEKEEKSETEGETVVAEEASDNREDADPADTESAAEEDSSLEETAEAAYDSEPESESSDASEAPGEPVDATAEETISEDSPPEESSAEEPASESVVGSTEQEPPGSRVGPVAVLAAMVLGGVVAAALGYFSARSDLFAAPPDPEAPTPAGNASALADQRADIAELGERIDALAAIDTDATVSAAIRPVEAAATQGISELTARLDQLTDRIDVLSDRVETIALRPTATGIDSDEFDDAIGEFRNQLNAAIAAADEAIASAQVQIDEAQTEAQRISSEAFSKEQAATARAAWSQIQTALESGAPFAESVVVVEDLTGETLPDALKADANDGVPTLAQLQQAYPDAARAALEASIRADTGEAPTDRFWSFIRVQSGVRSLAPREGDDPDAVLSRVEGALRGGDLAQALSEADALPDPGRDALSAWADLARTRLAALDAAEEMSSRLNSN